MASALMFTIGESVRLRMFGGDLISGTVDASDANHVWIHPDWSTVGALLKVDLLKVGSVARLGR